ncbi:MAG: EamA family transporter, partial [Chloroflexi bacterium]|nr:EamA family transporter [Chloroflexota bacterium]
AKLAKFYYDNGSEEKGLQLMFDAGAALNVRRLTQAPEMDGMLDDPAWAEVEPLTEFYQNINRMRAYPSSGRSEAYIGHRQGKIYIAVKGYEPTTDNLYRKATERDQNVWQDDGGEIFFDPGRSHQSYFQIIVNNIGTVFDQYSDGTSPSGDIGWNAEFEHAVHTEDDYWSMEIAFPLAQFSDQPVETGTVWGANLARVRIANLPYVTIVYTVTAVVLLVAAVSTGAPMLGLPAETYFWIAASAVFPQAIGHTLLNWALGHASATSIAMAVRAEPVIATLLAIVVLGEMPPWTVVPGGALVLAGVYLAIRSETTRERGATGGRYGG